MRRSTRRRQLGRRVGARGPNAHGPREALAGLLDAHRARGEDIGHACHVSAADIRAASHSFEEGTTTSGSTGGHPPSFFGGSPTPRRLPSPGSWGRLSTWGSSLPRRGPPGSPSSPRRRAAASARSVSWPRPTVSPMRLCPSRLEVVVGGVCRVLGRRDQGVRGGAVQRAVRHHDPLGCGGLVRLPSRRRTLPSSAPRPGTPRTSWPWPSGAFLPPARRRARGLWRASGTVACRSSLATPSRSSSPK